MYKQAGFPPIKTNIKVSDKKISKERYFANTKIKNFNIRKILSDKKKTPIIVIDENINKIDDNIEVVNTL